MSRLIPSKYLIWRLTSYFVVLFTAIVITFIVPRLLPGDPISIILSRYSQSGMNIAGSKELIEEYKRMFGLDRDLFTQFISYVRELLRGNLGYSIAAFPITVNELIMRALPWTIGLLTMTAIISWAIGTVLGAIAGWRSGKMKSSKLSDAINMMIICLYAIPYWLMAIMLIYLLAYVWPIFPASGGYTPGISFSFNLEFIKDVLWHATLPALSVVSTSLGWWFLSMKSMISGLQREDFIILAEAKGLSKTTILWKYAFRNALIPQVTGLAFTIGNSIGGQILMETIFAYPGLGWLLGFGVYNLDYPIIQGVVLLIIFSTLTATLILDFIYAIVDPRVRYGTE